MTSAVRILRDLSTEVLTSAPCGFVPDGQWNGIKRRDAESQSETPEKAIAYAWDDYNIIRESVTDQSAITNQQSQIICVWGLDLDGTMQGAGGVGGLLAVVKSSATYYPAYDANGNITEYVAADGTIAAHREYDPFGNTVVATGDAANFTHWFSTKPWCGVTGLSEYQYRKYSSVLGRWMSRAPLGDVLNIYIYCQNQQIVDLFGLYSFTEDTVGRCSQKARYRIRRQIAVLLDTLRATLADPTTRDSLVAEFATQIDMAYQAMKAMAVQARRQGLNIASPSRSWPWNNDENGNRKALNRLKQLLSELPNDPNLKIGCCEDEECPPCPCNQPQNKSDLPGYRVDGLRKGSKIYLCHKLFETDDQTRQLGCVVLHEMIHAIGANIESLDEPYRIIKEQLIVKLTQLIDARCGGYEGL